MLEAVSFFRHGDALNYHLVGSRFWLETSWLEMTHDLWGNFQSGVFELIYLFPLMLFGNTLWGQVSSQLIHFLLGQGLAAFVLYFYFKKKDNELIGSLSGLTILTISRSSDFFLYAKNDGALAACGLILALMLFDDSFLSHKKHKRNLLIGVLMGLVPAIKMSGLFIVGPLSIYFVYLKRKELKEVFFVASIALIVFSPILLRNAYFVGNPFFPGLINIFPGVLTEEMKSYYLYHMSSALTLSSLISALVSFFTGKIIFILMIPLFLYQIIKKRNLFFSALSLLIFALYLIVNGGLVVERFFFICYFLITVSIFIFIHKNDFYKKFLPLLLLIILIDSKADKSLKKVITFIPQYISRSPMDIVNEYSPYSRIWRGLESSREKRIVLSDLFAQQFYAPDGIRIHQFRGRPDTEFLGQCKIDDLSKLSRYTYAILAENNNNPCYQKIRNEGVTLNKVDNFVLYKIKNIQ
jgi:hypothetical protein